MSDRVPGDQQHDADPAGFSGEETGEPEPLQLVDPGGSPFEMPDGEMLVEGEDLSDGRRW
jgi:hypothetical protein